jgi:hypothetical protein
MAKPQNGSKDADFRENQVVVTAKRALGLNKFYIALGAIIGVGSLFLLNSSYATASNQGTSSGSFTIASVPLLGIPFTVLPMIMLTTPMVVLFVYDKNNGVLEYLISLGMTQGDIFARYLRAALLIAATYLLVLGSLRLLYSFVSFGTAYLSTTLTVLGVGTLIAISTVAFIMTMMMIFSSLQKSRSGGNQPLALTLGVVGVFPGYFIPFVFPYETAIALEVVQGVIIAVAAVVPILMSSRLVSREKFLP